MADINVQVEHGYDNFLMKRNDSFSVPTQTELSGWGGTVAQVPVKNEGAMDDVWIKNFIKSTDWKPKTRGFYIDGRTGYAEFMNLTVTSSITGLSIYGATFSTVSAGVNSPRVTITASNNINLYDDTVTGGTGNTSDIRFIHTSDLTESYVFSFKYRCGFALQTNNVLQIVASTPEAGGKNYLYIGRDGWDITTKKLNYIEIGAHFDPTLSASTSNGAASLSVDTAASTGVPNVLVTTAGYIEGDDAKVGACVSTTCLGADASVTNGFMGADSSYYAVTTLRTDDPHFYIGSQVPQTFEKSIALQLDYFTNAQKAAITPANGDLLYNTDTSKIEAYIGGAWVTLSYT